jgi:hypothetical protein
LPEEGVESSIERGMMMKCCVRIGYLRSCLHEGEVYGRGKGDESEGGVC